jgi:hypothetical protein
LHFFAVIQAAMEAVIRVVMDEAAEAVIRAAMEEATGI